MDFSLIVKFWGGALFSCTPSIFHFLNEHLMNVLVKSRPLEMKNTACKSRTINPVWKETFVLDVAEHVDEVLHVDVWNFMPDEKLREKLRKINDVRDSKGT